MNLTIIFKYIFSFTLVIFLVGCSSVKVIKSNFVQTEPFETNFVNKPSIGKIHYENVGDNMLATEIETLVPNINLQEEISLTGNIKTRDYNLIALPGKYEYVGSNNLGDLYVGKVLLNENKNYGGVIIPKTKEKPMSLYFSLNNQKYMIPGKKRYKFETSYSVEQKMKNFLQTLIYTGRNGNTINVTYREFLKGKIRPYFTQNLTFDLSKENKFSVKGANIEVIKFDNNSIEYKVLSHFDN